MSEGKASKRVAEDGLGAGGGGVVVANSFLFPI